MELTEIAGVAASGGAVYDAWVAIVFSLKSDYPGPSQTAVTLITGPSPNHSSEFRIASATTFFIEYPPWLP